MVRAIYKDGVIRPIDPVPSDWRDGQELVVDVDPDTTEVQRIAQWADEVAASARNIPQAEHDKFLRALEQQRREAKERMRREMGA